MAINIPKQYSSPHSPPSVVGERWLPEYNAKRPSLNSLCDIHKLYRDTSTEPLAPVFLPTAHSLPPLKMKSRFLHKSEISAYLMSVNPKHSEWLLSKADQVCEETLMLLVSAKNAKGVFLQFNAIIVQIQQDLWDKILGIEGYCNPSVQAHWVKSVTSDLSKYWTAVLRKVSGSVLPLDQAQEFTRLIDENHKLMENQAIEAGKVFMTEHRAFTLEQLVQQGASVEISLPNIEMTAAEKEAIMNATNDNGNNQEQPTSTPFPEIDPSMLDNAQEEPKVSLVKRAIATVKVTVTTVVSKVKSVVKKSLSWLANASWGQIIIATVIWCLFVFVITLGLNKILSNTKSIPAMNFSFGSLFNVVANFTKDLINSTKNFFVLSYNFIKSFFTTSGDVVVETASAAA